MRNKNYKLLVIGDAYDNHISRYVTNLKIENPSAKIDLFTINRNGKVISENVLLNVNRVIYRDRSTLKNRVLKELVNALLLIKQFRYLSKKMNYELINLHFPTFEYVFIVKYLNRISSNLILTPWGSDLYRIDKLRLFLLRRLYKKSDFVTVASIRFKKDLLKMFKFSENKIIELDIGSETIDYISKNENTSTIEARENLGIEKDAYYITCGYNGVKAQNHIKIIESIFSIRNKLPENLILLFPMTYGGDSEYHNIVKLKVRELGLSAIFFDEYLNLDTLFNLRMATDIFIHSQTTDANAGTIQEYLLCKKKVLNGSWLRYKELEKFGLPYFLIEDINNLSNDILRAFYSHKIQLSENLITYIKSNGWEHWIQKWNMFFLSRLN